MLIGTAEVEAGEGLSRYRSQGRRHGAVGSWRDALGAVEDDAHISCRDAIRKQPDLERVKLRLLRGERRSEDFAAPCPLGGRGVEHPHHLLARLEEEVEAAGWERGELGGERR